MTTYRLGLLFASTLLVMGCKTTELADISVITTEFNNELTSYSNTCKQKIAKYEDLYSDLCLKYGYKLDMPSFADVMSTKLNNYKPAIYKPGSIIVQHVNKFKFNGFYDKNGDKALNKDEPKIFVVDIDDKAVYGNNGTYTSSSQHSGSNMNTLLLWMLLNNNNSGSSGRNVSNSRTFDKRPTTKLPTKRLYVQRQNAKAKARAKARASSGSFKSGK